MKTSTGDRAFLIQQNMFNQVTTAKAGVAFLLPFYL